MGKATTTKTRAARKAARKKAAAKGKLKLPSKWQVVENVAAALERIKATVPGTVVGQKVFVPCLHDATQFREVDVVVEIPASGRTLRIGVDVKNEGRALDTNDMGALADKQKEIGLSEYFVLSTSGFSDTALDKAKRAGIHVLTAEEFEVSAFWRGAPGQTQTLTRRMMKNVRGNFIFDDEVFRKDFKKIQKLSGVPNQHIQLYEDTGSCSLKQFLDNHVRRIAMEMHDASPGHPPDFDFPIDVTFEPITRMTVRGKDVPVPQMLKLLVHVAEETEALKELRFRIGDIELSTVAFEHGGELQQFTMAAVPRPEGGRKLVIARGPARPSKNSF